MPAASSIKFGTMLLLAAPSLLGLTFPCLAAPSTNALSPEQERASFQLADPQLTIELVAAEPQIISPVAIAFDADGRLFVAEMQDYPNSPTSGRIKLLEDRDGDGTYETATAFADRLPFPNGVLPWNGGVLVTAAPDIWYLRDTDGDGHADERRVLFAGFGQGNQQLRVNGLMWGLDNWVYGANGRSEGEVHPAEDTSPAARTVSIRGHDFRFRPGTTRFEAVAGRSQFGLARDDWGNRFLSWNTIPVRHEVLPERYLIRNPHLAVTESVFDTLEPGDTGRVFPLTPPPLTFNNESVKHFNALAGLTVYRGDALGEACRGNVFVGESLLNLVHRRVLDPSGVTFCARRAEHEKEFLASRDPWFHPVNFATGPDGALYVVDFYRRFVEHPDFVHGTGRQEIPWRAGAEHGRVWRIRNPGVKTPNPKPNLSHAGPAELVGHLGDANGWWRDTSQRLLVERQERAAIPALEKLIHPPADPLARLHALCTLDGLTALKPSLLLAALKDPHPRVREAACRLSEPHLAQLPEAAELRAAVLALAGDDDARVRFQLSLTLGEFDTESNAQVLVRLAGRDFTDRWACLAILSSLGAKPWPFLKRLVQEDPRWLEQPTGAQTMFLDQVGRLVGANHSQTELGECLALLARPEATSSAAGRLSVLAGLADGLARTAEPLRRLLADPPPGLQEPIRSANALLELAAATASLPHEARDRLVAIRILARINPATSSGILLDQLHPEQPGEIQSAAAHALSELDDKASAQATFARWRQLSAVTRRRVLAVVPGSSRMTAALADALEQGVVAPVEISASLRQSLLRISDQPLQQRLTTLLQTISVSDRDQAVRRFQPALKLEGDPRRGAAVFARTCLTCHAVEGTGQRVGPDLSGVASRPKESLLVDILDPSRDVPLDYISYTLLTTEGKSVTGYIVSETAAGLTLRRAGEADETVLRRQIKELRAEGRSLMPDGLEQEWTQQDLADLLSFLQKPEAALLPELK